MVFYFGILLIFIYPDFLPSSGFVMKARVQIKPIFSMPGPEMLLLPDFLKVYIKTFKFVLSRCLMYEFQDNSLWYFTIIPYDVLHCNFTIMDVCIRNREMGQGIRHLPCMRSTPDQAPAAYYSSLCNARSDLRTRDPGVNPEHCQVHLSNTETIQKVICITYFVLHSCI